MNRTARRFSRALSALLMAILLFGQSEAFAWGNNGHMYVNATAAKKIPRSMPSFLRTSSAIERIEYLGPEPDRWRGVSEYALNSAQAPDHFINLEQIEGLGPLPKGRYEFYMLLYEKRAATPGHPDSMLPENVGLQPYIVVEIFERLRAAFRDYRHAKQSGRNTASVEQDIIFYAGWLGHYVGDAAQPLHTTVNHDGWVEANPQGFTTQPGIHWRFENDFVDRAITDDSFASLIVAPRRLADPFGDYLKYLRESHELVHRVYEFDKSGALNGGGTPESIEFTKERLAAASQMLLDLWYTAWVQSADPPAAP